MENIGKLNTSMECMVRQQERYDQHLVRIGVDYTRLYQLHEGYHVQYHGRMDCLEATLEHLYLQILRLCLHPHHCDDAPKGRRKYYFF